MPGGASVACSTAKAVEWDASWAKNLDPSGRAALGVHLSDYDKVQANSGVVQPEIINNVPQITASTQGVEIRS